MTQVLGILKMILSMLPAIIDAIKALEAAFPQSGLGPGKLATIREMLSGAFATVQDIGLSFEQIWPALDRVIASLVSLFNTTGQFKK